MDEQEAARKALEELLEALKGLEETEEMTRKLRDTMPDVVPALE